MQHFQELFAHHVSTLYIADGHHRTQVTARLAQYLDKSLMIYAALFSSAQIKITAFHRVIEGIKGRTVATFLMQSQKFVTFMKRALGIFLPKALSSNVRAR
ncbi:MAG: DUF1015 domain-containing protein [Saprospiraceae bacterium]|nr:DUF1015 domain-containing protein [Saprospiraceae bacterium]